MDPPVNLPESLTAAQRTVRRAAKSSPGVKAQGEQKKSQKTHGSSSSSLSSFLSQELKFHILAGAGVGLAAYTFGLASALASLLVGIAVVCVYASDAFPNPLLKAVAFIQSTQGQESRRKIRVDQWIDNYNSLHEDEEDSKDDKETGVDKRNSSYATLVNAYYELATLFYEIGWGTSFHFATRRKNETFAESIKRHEYFLASKLGNSRVGEGAGVAPGAGDGGADLRGKKLLDVGCGVGGPYRNIARFTGADVTGITLNEYQVQRGNRLSQDDGLLGRCRSVQGDFMKLPFRDNSFDGAYAIEATCHAPKREGVYSEIYRVLKPGACFAMYEWCLTPLYDPNNAEHRIIKKKIEEGDGLPDMALTTEIDAAIESVGFEVLESRDIVEDELPGDIPWYQPLTPSWNILTQRFQFTDFGRSLTVHGLRLLEFLRLAPAGTCKVQKMLLEGGEGCARGGQLGIFTPMYMVVVRKPLNSE